MSPMMGNFMEELDYQLYDREPIAGMGRTVLFCRPVNGVKSLAKTNMYTAGFLPAPQMFTLKGMTCAFYRDDTPVPLHDPLWANAVLQLCIGQKPYWEGPSFLIADPATIATFSTDDPPEWVKHCLELHRSRLQWEHPVSIETGDFFHVRAEFEREVSGDVELQVTLDGTLMRAVQ